jgi:hypothetical protein
MADFSQSVNGGTPAGAPVPKLDRQIKPQKYGILHRSLGVSVNSLRAPGANLSTGYAGTGRWRPTNINGGISGVWEFEATGASPAAARPGTRCTRPPALRHRRSLSGVWGVWPPQKGLRTSSRGRKPGYKLVRHA